MGGQHTLLPALGWLAWAGLVGLTGCGNDRDRTEAQTFLASYGAISYTDPPAARLKRVDALAQLPLSNEEIRETRDRCVMGHRSLLEQEQAQEKNEVDLDKVLANGTDGEPLPAEAVASLKSALAASEKALTRAREQLRGCESGARTLELRFGRR